MILSFSLCHVWECPVAHYRCPCGWEGRAVVCLKKYICHNRTGYIWWDFPLYTIDLGDLWVVTLSCHFQYFCTSIHCWITAKTTSRQLASAPKWCENLWEENVWEPNTELFVCYVNSRKWCHSDYFFALPSLYFSQWEFRVWEKHKQNKFYTLFEWIPFFSVLLFLALAQQNRHKEDS